MPALAVSRETAAARPGRQARRRRRRRQALDGARGQGQRGRQQRGLSVLCPAAAADLLLPLRLPALLQSGRCVEVADEGAESESGLYHSLGKARGRAARGAFAPRPRALASSIRHSLSSSRIVLRYRDRPAKAALQAQGPERRTQRAQTSSRPAERRRHGSTSGWLRGRRASPSCEQPLTAARTQAKRGEAGSAAAGRRASVGSRAQRRRCPRPARCMEAHMHRRPSLCPGPPQHAADAADAVSAPLRPPLLRLRSSATAS